jgi:hypothetical protein
MLKKVIVRIIGKKANAETMKLSEASKTKLIAIVAVLAVAIPKLSEAWGMPIQIPGEVFEILAACGLWTLRDAVKE